MIVDDIEITVDHI
ncbi:hypothetical protein TNIN_359961, partial [Trichonephila inaurata madagascariensis]